MKRLDLYFSHLLSRILTEANARSREFEWRLKLARADARSGISQPSRVEHTGNPPDCSIRPASGGRIDPIFPNFQRRTDRFDNQRVTRFEVLIEAAHVKASFLHQVRDDLPFSPGILVGDSCMSPAKSALTCIPARSQKISTPK
jgi:hypothetical protein